jgi:hypothetical protein
MHGNNDPTSTLQAAQADTMASVLYNDDDMTALFDDIDCGSESLLGDLPAEPNTQIADAAVQAMHGVWATPHQHKFERDNESDGEGDDTSDEDDQSDDKNNEKGDTDDDPPESEPEDDEDEGVLFPGPSPGLSASDLLGERFACEASNVGEPAPIPVHHLSLSRAQIRTLPFTAEKLSPADVAIMHLFALKTTSHLTHDVFSKLAFTFSTVDVPSWKATAAQAAFISGISPTLYDCCPNSCCYYIGPHAELDKCPYCESSCYNADGRAQKKFTYVPLIPRLVSLFKNADFVDKMQYRAGTDPKSRPHQHVPGMVTDIFDGTHYCGLLETRVTVDNEKMPYRFFSDSQDIALGLSTDGFAPFRRRKATAWPLLLFNFNLPPEIRFHIQYLLCLGVVPGPKKPKDFDSFLFPLVEELLTLTIGVVAYDARASESVLFRLRAYLIIVFGDIPAISMVMCMKGHNGIRPCRMCSIQGLRIPDSQGNAHYVPLDHSQHPCVRNSATAIETYDPADLPLRTHDEIMQQGCEADLCTTAANAERLSKESGVKGLPLLSHVPGLQFPLSFPFDFMHLIWENLIKNLILL